MHFKFQHYVLQIAKKFKSTDNPSLLFQHGLKKKYFYLYTFKNQDRGCNNKGWSHKARAAVNSRSRIVDGRRPEVDMKGAYWGHRARASLLAARVTKSVPV